MANVRVAVRVRPLSKREIKEGGRIIVEVDDKVTKIRNVKVSSRPENFGDSREKVVAFGFDYCYWSVNPEDPQYASQEVVFQDLGTEVLSGAAKGYNICLFAYGQTGSGKTYTMLGTPASVGLTPRICEGLFIREDDCASGPSSCSIKVSFLEIYNERVRDLLKRSSQNKSYSLKVREHPEMGPYVQGLSQHVVTNYQQVIRLLEEGIANRITAATHVHEASSRSHAIFTVHYTQVTLQNSLPSETISKINLVDLAGSERADPSYCKNRITEGANINKSLVTLGIVISTLAQNSRVFSSFQSLSSAASSGGDSGVPSTASGTSSGGGPVRRQSYIPYRDSVLTWLLKESLGGNSKTIMVATVSPAHTSYSETMSTLRYASNAKNIINKPQVNQDANVKLIRDLREEIDRLKAMLLRFELIDHLTQDRMRKWNDWQTLVEHYGVDINRRRAGVVIDSSLPHLMAVEDDVLSTSVVIYHLKEGTTKIGRIDSDQEQDIVLQGQWIERDHCTITSTCGVVILRPTQGARCTVNGREVTASCRLTQGAVITLGKAQKFRFNHPAEAALLRHHRLQVGEALGSSDSLEWLNLDGDITASRLGLCPVLWKERKVLQEECDKNQETSRNGKISHRTQTEQQQCYVEDLRQQAIEGQSRVQKEPELDQTHNSQKIKDNEQWLLRGETWLASLQETQQEDDSGNEKELAAFVASDAWLPQILPSALVQSQKRVVQLQCLRRHTSRATVWNIRQKKFSFQLKRIIKKRRLLETQKRLEQLRAFYWLQDDGASKAPSCVSSSNTSGPGSQRRSRWTTCSSLNLQRLCSQPLSQLHSAFMNWNPSTMSPPVPDLTHQIPEKTLSADSVPQVTAYPPRIGRNSLHLSGWRKLYPARGASTRRRVSTHGSCLTVSHKSVNSQETETLGKQPCQMSSQGLVTKKLKPRDGSRTTATQTRRAKGLVVSGSTQTGWQKEGSCGTYKPHKETTSHSTYLSGSEQVAGHGKVVKTFQVESKPSLPSRTSQKHQRVLPARGRDAAKKFSHLPHGSPLKRQPSRGNPDTLASFTDSRPMRNCVRENDNDLSDTDSSYSVDSLSYVYAKVPKELQKPEDLQEKWDLPDQENSQSDNSQISEDSLAEKGYQSPLENSGGEYSIMNHGQSRARISSSIRHFPKPSDSSLCAQAHRSFSLDSLIDAEELEEDRQEEPFLGSADEMPTETFWHLQKATLAAVDQEAMCRPSPVNHRTGVKPNAFQPKSNSFYLDPHFQPHCEKSESEMAANYSEQANSLQGMQLARESPLVSVDSWFSCDSKVNLSSPSATVQSLCPSPDVHEIQPHDEMPRHWINIEEVKPLGTVLPHSSKLPQGSAEPPCSSDLYANSASDTSKPSVCGSQRLLQSGADDALQGKEILDMIYQGISEESHNSDMSSVLAPSATSLTHVGSTIHEKDWAALQQKYLLELSNSILEAVEEPRPAFSFLEEDSSSLTEASEKVDTHLPVGSGVSKNLDFNYFPVHLSKIRHLRAEKDHDSLSANLESSSDLFSTTEKVSYNGAYSADLESLTSGSVNAQSCTEGNKIPNYVTEAWEVKQASLEGCLQGSRNSGLTTSSGQYFFQKKAYHNHDTLATKADQWPQDGALLRKNTAVPSRLLSHHSHPHPLLEENADSQQQAKETGGTHTDISCTSPSGPELFLHSAPWSPFPSSLQPPPLETFYVTKSRDALTETALEIPACREAWVPSPPPREAWGFGHSYQVLQKAHRKNNLPKLSRSQNSKIDSSYQVTSKRPTNLNTEVTEELEKCTRNMSEEGNLDSAYCFVAHNKHHLPSTSFKVCECGNELGIFNKKYSFSVHKEGEGTSAWHHCSVAFDGTESKTVLFICDSKASGEEQSLLPPQEHACSAHSQPSGTRSDFIGKITSLDLEKVIPEETAVSLKSRSLHCRVSSPVIMARGGNPTHRWEERNETVLLREVISKDIQEESSLPGTQYTCERCHLVMCPQERKPIECKAHGQSQEKKSKEEPLGEKQNMRVNNADEMARLIRSVMQLETGILEIESKQNKQLHASQTTSTEFMLQALQDQERADHALIPESSGKHLFFDNQPSFPIQTEDGILGDSESGEMEGNNAVSNNAQTLKSIGSSFRSGGYAHKKQSESEHWHPPPGVEGLAKDMCDFWGKSTTLREPSNISLHSRRMKVLARALPWQPSVESSPEEEDELLKASADFQDHAWTLGNLEEPETMGSFQESQIVELLSDSGLQDTKAHGRVEGLAVGKGGNLQEENMVSSTQKLPAPSHQCKGTFSSQETGSPFHSQTSFSAALPYAEPSGIQPLQSPSLPRHCLHASDTKGISSFDYMLEPTMLKINTSSLTTGVGHQDYSGEARSNSPQGIVTGVASTVHTAWCGAVMPMVMRADDQSVTPESILLETEDWITVSTSLQEDQRGDFRVTSTGLASQEGLGSEYEATVQKEIKTSSLDGVSRQTEKRVSFLLKEDSEHGKEERQKAEKSEDQQPSSSACLTPLSPLRAPDPEPLPLPDSSIHASICLAILAEIRQAKAQRKHLNDFAAEGTILPCETSQEECFSEASGLSGSKQDHVQCSDASTSLEEMKASPKSYAVHPGAPRKVEAEAHMWHPVKWKNADSGLAEVREADSQNPVSLLDQRPILHLSRAREDAPGLYPKECLVFEGSTGGSRPPGLSYEEEENRTIPCPQLTGSQPTAVHARCSHSSTLPCYRDGFLRKETPQSAPHPVHSHFIVPSRACEVDRTIENFSKDSQVFLAHDLEHKHVHVEFGPVDSSIPNPSTAAAISSQAQSCYPIPTSEVKANCLTFAVAGGKSVEGSEKKTSGKKASTAPQDAYPTSPAGSHSEPLRTLKDNSVGENIQASQAKPEPPVVTQGPHTLNLNEGSVDSELVMAAQYGHLGNITRQCSEKTQPSTEVRGHSCLGSQANFRDRLKHTCHPQIETSWEEEEQQRDQALGDGKDHAQVRSLASSNEGGFDGSYPRDSEKEEVVVAKSPVSQTFFSDLEDPASLPLGQTETSQPDAQTPGQLFSGREQLAFRHRHTLPVIAVFSGPKHARYSPRPHFSVVSSSRSIHELNLRVEPPSPADEDAQAPKRLWSPRLRTHSSEKPMSTSPETQDCNLKAPFDVNNSPTDHRPLKPVIPPYPTSSTGSCMPTPDFMTNWMPGTLEQAHQGKTDKLNVQGMPENWHSQVDKEVLHFGSSDKNPYVLPWCPQEPVDIGWKQYVFGSVVDVSCSQKPQSLIPPNMTRCSRMNNALDDKKSPFHSHLRTYTQTRDLPNMCNRIENDQSSNEGWEMQSSSLAVEKPHILIGSEGVAPTWDPDKRPPFRGSSEEKGCLRSELSLVGGSATAPGDEIVLLCPSETACAVRQARMNTFEQGTQTLGSRLHWSCTDVSAQSDSRTVSDFELASWTSMHNLSLHLSQLLHSTSELLGSLSQPSVVPKKQSIKNDSPDEAPQALMTDGSTQTTVDEGIQTDLALPPLSFKAPEVKPQEVNVILEMVNSGITTMFQEKEDVLGEFPKRGTEESAEAPDLHEGSIHYNLQSPSMPSPCLRFQKAHLGQNLTFESPPASLSSPPSLQPEASSMVVNSPSILHHSELFLGTPELTQESDTQKKPGPSSALLVDRASSPILTFSASTQDLSNTLASLTLSVPSAHSLGDVRETAISPDLAVGNPRPLMDNSQATNGFSVSQRAGSLEREDKSPLGKSSEGLVLDSSSPCSPQQSSSLQVSFSGQAPQQLQPMNTTGDQSSLPSSPPRHRSLKLDDSFVPKKVASIEHGLQSSRRPSQCQDRAANGDENSLFVVEPQPSLDISSPWRGLQPHSFCPISDTTGLPSPAVELPQACQSEGLLCPGSHVCVAPDLQHHSLRDLPVHNKFDNWYGVQDGSCGGLPVSENLGVGCDSHPVDQTQRSLKPSDNYNQEPEWPQFEHVPLQVGVQKPSLSVELTEAKLHRGFGETDALLKVLQNGTGEVFAPQEPAMSSCGELYTRQKKTIETLRREGAERLHNFRRTRSLSPQKQFCFLPSKDLPTWEHDLPSRRRGYLQQLRKDVVETTRILEPAPRSVHPPSDIELMLRDYHQAREEAKVEIAKAQDRLRQRTEQEKLRIRQQIISQLLKEEEKLQGLANSSSLCTSSNGSLSSGVTSGYNSSTAFSGHLQSLEVQEDSRVPDFRDTWIGDWRGRSTVRNSQLYLTRSSWKSLAHRRRASLGSGCCSPSSPSSLGTCFSFLYQDLAKHIVNTSMADVMAACSDNLHNLFSRQATAGWNYQGEEQEVQLYYKEFSSTRHGFLGAGVVLQPLSRVWAAVSDPTLWPLYHKPIQTARLHQRVSNSISLVYLVCDTTLCALKQLRDFCCVCVEAKEGHLSIMAAQSVYDTSMPRPSRKMVRGEILPSAWVLQPVITEGKEITRVVFLAQVELGAPGFPPHLLNSFIKQQPLVVAKLASFLGS